MSNSVFSQYASKLLEDTISTYTVIEPVDAMEFITSSAYLNETPTPFQRVALKTLYSLWPQQPPDAEEEALLATMKRNWDISIDLDREDKVTHFVLALGRRSTKCERYSTEVIIASGEVITLEELYKNKEKYKEILTVDNTTLRVKKTSDFDIYPAGKKECYRVITKSGRCTSTSLDHRYRTLFKWEHLKDLKIGDRIAIPSIIPVFGNNNLSVTKAKALGYVVGDGGCTCPTSDFTNIDKEILQDFSDILETDFKGVTLNLKKGTECCYNISRLRENGSFNTRNPFTVFLEEHGVMGKKSIDKTVPKQIFTASKKTIAAFLNGLYSCDGCVVLRKSKKSFKGVQVLLGISSKQLAIEVQGLLLRFGIVASFKYTPTQYKHKGEIRKFDSWKVTIGDTQNVELFLREIGFTGEKQQRAIKILKQIKNSEDIKENNYLRSIPKEIWNYLDEKRAEKGIVYQDLFGTRKYGGGIDKTWSINRNKLRKAANALNDSYLHALCDGDLLWDEIASIEYDGKFDTYDISVPETENFIADNIMVHNSTIASYFATYALYTLICRGNPQEYYGIRERHPIFVTHVAAAGHQAEAVFTLTKDNLRKAKFFTPYVDFDKNSSTELRLYTPYDAYLNSQIKAKNLLVQRGEVKEPILAGSLYAKSITTSAATHRGDATFMLMLSEFAHFQRAHIDPTKSADQLAEENPQTDYAVDKALVPSTKDFGLDAKVIYESSPAEKGGQFYHHYCIAGGMEQEPDLREEREINYALIQLATWEARPTISKESLEAEFRTDPVGASSEYGAHFRNPSGAFISEAIINSIPQTGFPLILTNPSNWRFVIIVDAGGKGKSKKADTYALGWGHADIKEDERLSTYWIDGLKGWDAQIKDLGMGAIEHIPVDPNMVLRYIVDLMEGLGGKNFVTQICYDQWQNQMAVSMLQNAGIPAIETTFTNQYKALMYGNFFSKAEHGQVKMFGEDADGWVERWRTEMKYLQRITSGKTTYYRHPDSGPVQHDDFADVVANLVYRLSVWYYPTKETMKQNLLKKQGMPIQRRTTISPVRGPNLSGGGSGLADRLRRR